VQRLRHPCVRIAAVALVLAGALWFAGSRLEASAASADRLVARDAMPMLALALALFMLAALLLGGVWIVLVESATGRASRRIELMLGFLYAWIARYIPGTLPYLAGKVYLARRAGYETRSLVMMAAVQNIVEAVAASVFALAALALTAHPVLGMPLALALALTPLPVLAVLHPRAVVAASAPLLRLCGRAPLPRGELPSPRAMLVAVALVFASQAANALALLAILHAAGAAAWSDAPLVAAASSVAGVAGMVVVLAPAGLGVRDGAMAALLASRFVVQTATLAAVALRLLTVIADLVLTAVALLVDVALRKHVLWRALRGDLRPAPSRAQDPPVAALPQETAA